MCSSWPAALASPFVVCSGLACADQNHDAKDCGFAGINGEGWTAEHHPFSSPS